MRGHHLSGCALGCHYDHSRPPPIDNSEFLRQSRSAMEAIDQGLAALDRKSAVVHECNDRLQAYVASLGSELPATLLALLAEIDWAIRTGSTRS